MMEAILTRGAQDGQAGAAQAAPARLALRGIVKRFGQLQVLHAVDLEIAPGEIHCLLGENGAGKSTLCNVIFGVHGADGGAMALDGQPHQPHGPAQALQDGIAMVHQHFSLVRDMTVVDNLMLGQAGGLLRRKEMAARIVALGRQYGLELDPHARVADLSVGQRQRVEIVKCLMREPRLLVLDEPTAVLLPNEIAALLQVCKRVAAQGCSVVLVTHKLAEIRQVADRATVLRAGRVVATSAQPAADLDRLVGAMIGRDPASTALTDAPAPQAQERQQEQQEQQQERQQQRQAQHGRQALQAHEHEHRHEQQQVQEQEQQELEHEQQHQRGRAAAGLQDEVLQVDGLCVDDALGARRLDNFTLVLNKGEIVGVAGVEGNGQGELAAALAGMVQPSAGRFYVKRELLSGRTPREITAAGVGIVPEDRHAVGCITALSVAENLFLNRMRQFTRWGRVDRKAMRAAARELMARFDVRAASEDTPFSGLSGGNQQKAVLGRELTLPNLALLVAAQPTRGLDVGAVAAVYGHIRAARGQGVAVLLISSELDELLAVADRIVVLYRGRIMGVCPARQDQRERIGAMMAGQAA